jgi:type IX secretion system PorP/SprF family membrane protein
LLYNIFAYFTFYVGVSEPFINSKKQGCKNMKKLILVFIASVSLTGAFSQQERQVSHYMYDHISVNPGSAGNSDMISAHGIMRQQWPGMEGAPQNFILNLSAPIKLGSTHHGVGLSVWSDQLGFNKDIDLTFSYAYQFSVGNGRLGLGISGNYINRQVNGDWIYPDQNVNTDDDVPIGKQNDFAFDMGAGLFYSTDELYVGLSSTRILQSKFDYENSGTGISTSEKLSRNYYLTAGYTIQLSNPALEFLPSVFLQTDTKETKIDVNATLMYNKKFWGGVSYRLGSAVVGMVGLTVLNGVKVGYAYDFDTSKLQRITKGGHEIMVGYDFRIGVDRIPQKYKSIRYL